MRLRTHALTGFTVTLALAAGLGLAPSAARAQDELITDGGFEELKSSSVLQADNDGQDWYESRKDKAGRKLLMLSTKPIYGNKTQKAMIKEDPELNTYLSQSLASPQSGKLRVRYDIAVKSIRPEFDRSGFFFAGTSNDKKRGPNSTGKERFAMLGFENAGQEGKLNLFAREGERDWDDRTIIAQGLDTRTWYTITVELDVPAQTYTVQVNDGPVVGPLQAFKVKGEPVPDAITDLSFASWNDGAGTFYVDNVSARAR
ncbi:MAG: hypothetical protein R3D98_12785 [Candidatus Krumholzibacteriia bacterium]